MKICTNCKIEKEKTKFYPKMGWCKFCHNQRMKKWQKEHPESLKKAWTKGNRKRRKGRICQFCGTTYKIANSQLGCSLKCRFELAIERKETGCWHWIKGKGGKKGKEYGHISIGGKHYIASRISYELHKGPITEGLFVLHTCDNPICVNPDHLYLGNHQQNMDDMNNRGRGNKNRWHYRKYDYEKCQEVIKLRKEGLIYREIAEITGVRESACKYICKNPQRFEKFNISY